MLGKRHVSDARVVYRSSPQAIGIALMYLFCSALTLAATASRLNLGGQIGVDAGWVAFTAPLAARGVFAILMTDHKGVHVRNPFRTYLIGWADITAFELGRYKILGCVCLIHCTDGTVVPAFAVEGITGQPRRRTSIQAQTWVDELNLRLQRETHHAVSELSGYPGNAA